MQTLVIASLLLVHVALLICVGHNLCCLDDVLKPWFKSPSQCVHDMIDAWRL